MNEHNRAILLARIERTQEILVALKMAVQGDFSHSSMEDMAQNLARQMRLLLDEANAVKDGC